MAGSAPARVYSANVMHVVRGRLLFSATGFATGIEIGTIPAGSFVEQPIVEVLTAFNAATTNVVDIGSAGVATGFAAGATVAAGTAGYKGAVGAGALLGDHLTADTPVVVKYTQTGTAATAGEIAIVVKFYPHTT